MTTTWASGSITCKSDEQVLSVTLNKATFGCELNQETSALLRDFANFLIASDARVQELIKLAEIYGDNADD